MMMEYTEKSALPLIESTYEDLTATEPYLSNTIAMMKLKAS